MRRSIIVLAALTVVSSLALADNGGNGGNGGNLVVQPGAVVFSQGPSTSSASAPLTNVGNGTAQILGSGNLTLANGAISPQTNLEVSTPRQAPGVAMTAPTQPITSCRTSISLFGSSPGGSGGGGIPLGNDATCLAGAALAAMDRVPGFFTQEERAQIACTIEGMSKLVSCQKLLATAGQ